MTSPIWQLGLHASTGPRVLLGSQRIAGITSLVLAAVVLASPVSAAEAGPPVLVPESEFSGEATAEETALALDLTAGDFARVLVAQHGVDLALVLQGPAGDTLAERDSPTGRSGEEELSVVAPSSGRHQLLLRRSAGDPAGDFVARLAVRRPATAADHLWAGAEATGYDALVRSLRRAPGEREASLDGWRRAADLWRRLGEVEREAAARLQAARVASQLRRYEEALELYRTSLGLWQATDDERNAALALNNLGSTLRALRRPEEAQEHLERALELWRRLGDSAQEAITLNNLGMVLRARGERLAALGSFERSLELRPKEGDRSGEARTLTNLGVVWKELGELQRSIDAYRAALDIWSGTHRQRDRRDQAATLNSLGALYRGLGDFRTARVYYDQALVLNRQLGARDREAATLFNLGWLHHLAGEPALADKHYSEALKASRELGDRSPVEAAVLNGLGRLRTETGQAAEARQYFKSALAIYREVENRRGTAFALQGLGDLERRAGRMDLAGKYLEEALEISLQTQDLPGQAARQIRLARIEGARGDLTRALALGRDSLKTVEALRGEVIRPDLRAAFSATRRGYYETHIDLLFAAHRADPAAGHDAEAFETSERARARSLLETLAAARVELRQGVDGNLLRREEDLSRQLNADGLHRRELEAASASPEEIAALDRRIAERVGEYRHLLAEIKQHSRHLAALPQPEPLALGEIQRSLLKGGELLLEYALGEERSFLLAVTSDSLDFLELPPRRRIEDLARRLHETLTARGRGVAGPERGRSDRQAQELARKLSDAVLGPVVGRLGDRRLVIVPDGALQYVPFAALPTPSPTSLPESPMAWFSAPLVAGHEISVQPSISTLGVLRREWARRKDPPKSLALWADPVFGRRDPRLETRKDPGARDESPSSTLGGRQIDSRGQGLTRLDHSADEAAAIAALEPGARTFLGFEATRYTLSEAGSYGFLHFATHGVIDTEHPELSGLALSLRDRRGDRQDGFLRLHDIYNLELNAKLVVLSACRTALGKEIRGEGLMSLTRGFFHAGARRVVASLWNVDDRARAELMERFYRQLLREGRPPASALRQAQLALARERAWRSPFYWAGFVLQGEWR